MYNYYITGPNPRYNDLIITDEDHQIISYIKEAVVGLVGPCWETTLPSQLVLLNGESVIMLEGYVNDMDAEEQAYYKEDLFAGNIEALEPVKYIPLDLLVSNLAPGVSIPYITKG